MSNEPVFPVPATISAEAQAVLAAAAQRPMVADPEPDDDAGWYEHAAVARATDEGTITGLALATTGAVIDGAPTTLARASVADGARYYVAEPLDHDSEDERVLFAIHGGGFTFGGGESARVSTSLLAGNYGVRTWGMDYRQLPDHPYPAGLDDCMTVYRHLLSTTDASAIAIGGQSGGANLTAAMLLRIRDEGLPMPAAAMLLSPPVDLTSAGDTHVTNGFTVIPGGIANMSRRYAGEHSLEDPYISPLFGEFTAEFPPTILTAGTRDFLLSDTVRLHRKLLAAGVRAELHVWEGAPHGLFMGRAPEDREQVRQVRTFLEQAWAEAGHPAS
ncbi:alpha/beta hydrolase fold domain-containing protein [Demequina globuliformis]|uniref:alpha/beta hydrolase fold domain-containing protein n=1 Tax=Demequina globuliformis TaxID=676202 RepID=UPI0007859D88|nr:alpha/beta hydrolase fold domain-containing protein [Demequina globuliformis]